MPRTFKLLDTLGQGAFSSVHLAEVQGGEGFVQRLAVKWLHAHFDGDAELASRLRDEARLLALLEHDHIVRVHGLTRISGRLAILMEPIQGADLSKVEHDPMPPRAAVEAVEAVAEALDAAWETVPPGQSEPLRVVHRDIKPSNIMVTSRGGVKVMDFGVARARFEAREASTRSQQFGTARYMAPERWLEGVAEAASDTWSLGITLVELVTGKPVERARLSREGYAEDLARALSAVEPWPEIRDLARDMCAFDHASRPSAHVVAERARRIAEAMDGPGLRQWSAEWVPRHQQELAATTGETEVVEEDVSGETFQYAPTEPYPSLSRGTLDQPRRGVRPVWVAPIAIAVIAGTAWALWPAPRPVDVPEPEPPPVAQTDPMEQEIDVPEVGPAPELPEPVVAELEPEPEPVRPTPRPRPVVVPAPVEPVAAAPVVARTAPVTFILDPPGLDVTTRYGTVRNRVAMELPHGVHRLTVAAGDRSWGCTVLVDDSVATWRIDGARQDCVQVK